MSKCSVKWQQDSSTNSITGQFTSYCPLPHTHTHQAAMCVSLMWVLKDSLSLTHTPHTHEHQCLCFWPECSRKTLAKSDGRQVVASSGRTTASISLRTSQWRETSTCIAAERMSEFLSWMPAHRSSSSTWQIRQTDNWFLTPCQQWLGKSTETDFVRTQYMLKKIYLHITQLVHCQLKPQVKCG